MVIYKGIIANEHKLGIEKIYTGSDESVKFGSGVKVKFNFYKAKDTKTSLKFYIQNKNDEKVSYVSYVNFYNDYTNYTQTGLVQLKANCNGKIPNDEYELVFEGFGFLMKEEIKIDGITSSLCQTKYSTKSSSNDNILNPMKYLGHELLNFTIGAIPVRGDDL